MSNIELCYQKSIELLKKNSSEFGFLASSPQKKAVERNYLSVFSRDASICSLGALASGDKELISTAKKSIITLVKNQADNGQIPNYVKPGERRVDFWRLGCIDATLWWLIVVELYNKFSGDKKLKLKYKKQINKALFWLECQEHPGARLLVQGEASDWADIMPRSGKVLYSNALWLFIKELYKIKNIKESRKSFDDTFYPFNCDTKKIIKSGITTAEEIIKKTKVTNFYLSYVGYMYWGSDIDVYANALSIVFNISNEEMQENIINQFTKKILIKKLPIPALFNPITKNSKMWRKYMESHNQNYPYQYHNGGIWPYVSCFWAMALFKAGKKTEAFFELEKIAEINKKNNWEFNEWFHAKTGRPGGMKYQSWNAGMFIFAYKYLREEFTLK